jgi:hypothetical protein
LDRKIEIEKQDFSNTCDNVEKLPPPAARLLATTRTFQKGYDMKSIPRPLKRRDFRNNLLGDWHRPLPASQEVGNYSAIRNPHSAMKIPSIAKLFQNLRPLLI